MQCTFGLQQACIHLSVALNGLQDNLSDHQRRNLLVAIPATILVILQMQACYLHGACRSDSVFALEKQSL